MRPSDPRVRRFLAPARAPVAGVLVSGLLSSLLIVVQAWVVTGLLVAVVEGDQVASWGWAVVATLALRAGVQWVGDVCATRAAARVGSHLRAVTTRAVIEQGPSSSSGAVAALLTRGVSSAEPYLTRYLPALALACVLPPLTVVAIATQDVASAVIVLATLPLVPVFGALVGLATRDRANEQWRAMESLSGHFLDVMRGLPTLVAFRRAGAQSATIARITDRYRRASMRTLRLAFASSAVLELVATLSVALVAVTVGVRLASGGLDLHTALVVLLLAPEAYWPLRRVGAEFHAAAEGVAAFEQVSSLVDSTAPHPVAGAPTSGDLVIEDLSLHYPGRTTPAVEHLSARIPSRGVTLVTGASGSGKSTLLGALAGLVTVREGRVTVGGAAALGPAWQRQVAWLPQRPLFVAGSVAQNLRLACPDATADQLWQALREVALEERVRTLPGALDAMVGEDGGRLSAGERARLALARVVLSDRPWVLMDEPTAHLDELTEQVIADTIVELGRHRGVVLVAHDPAMLELADHRLRLETPATTWVVSDRGSAGAPTHDADVAGEAEGGAEEVRARFWPATLLGSLASASGVALTATAGWLIVQASTQPAVLTLLVAIVAVRAFGLARPALRYVERLTSHDAALRLLAQRRVAAYDALVPLVPGALGKHRGDVLASVVDDVDSVVDDQLRVRLPVRSFGLVCLAAALFAAWALPAAALVIAVVSGSCAVAAFLLARTGSAHAERESVEQRAQLSDAVVDLLQIRTELVMWQRVDRAVAVVEAASERLGAAVRRTGRWVASARAVLILATGGAMAATAGVASAAVRAGDIGAPMAALLVLLPLALLDVALPLADAGSLSSRTGAAGRLDALGQMRPAVQDGPGLDVPVSNQVELEHVRAGWGGATALDDVSISLEPGARTAVVGRSGSGKSTLAALLLRFLDPVCGHVRLGGSDLRDLPLEQVRRVVGLVDDDPHVFASTLVENVRLARPRATDDEVDSALRDARLGAWLDGLPDGLHTWLGDGHQQISGGERARLALARSLLAEQPVLVLDEPTAHLDHATATELATELLTGPRRHTIVWITHDRVGLDLVDDVVVLEPKAQPTRAPAPEL
ncbi:thiol reductant ABC exporter subunit CydD [Marmoricola sp. URHB0036]|uniref:thiol reductant ABC exporter subunit CydD n=1 Tax=Marmoricola sp. URHB0036 TaxID=1298863 RepID=UPI0006866047|nr:thiol reductant ABC exporter subunit CydD [Marmoricola sp. URHB0036]